MLFATLSLVDSFRLVAYRTTLIDGGPAFIQYSLTGRVRCITLSCILLSVIVRIL